MEKLRLIYASAYSAAFTVGLMTAVTIAAELSPVFKNWLAQMTGHHWITKSYMSLAAFVVCVMLFFFIKKSASDYETQKALFVLQIFSILGFIAILGFYLYEFFAH